jgi:hypothetical protein
MSNHPTTDKIEMRYNFTFLVGMFTAKDSFYAYQLLKDSFIITRCNVYSVDVHCESLLVHTHKMVRNRDAVDGAIEFLAVFSSNPQRNEGQRCLDTFDSERRTVL